MKRLAAKTGEFTNAQNETKGEYTKIGVLMEGQNGEYMLLEPTVNLAGVLAKQNALSMAQGKQPKTSVMISVFDDSQQQRPQANQQGYQQRPQQGGYQQQQQGVNQAPPQMPDTDFDYDKEPPF